MHPERRRLIDELFHAASELPPNERGNFLASACQGDASLRAEIEKLIDGSDRAGDFIESPPALDPMAIALPEPAAEPLATTPLRFRRAVLGGHPALLPGTPGDRAVGYNVVPGKQVHVPT